jgi:AraC-like DNA-binding protein
MKPDGPPRRLDIVERAHLKAPDDRSHVIYRYAAPDDLTDLVRRFWLPVWSVPPGEVAVQRVLQYPVALTVITPAYGRFAGVARGVSTTELEGDAWAVGVMFQPAAGSLLTGGSMDEWTDRADDLRTAVGPVGDEVVARVRALMHDDPHDEAAHRAAIDVVAGLARAVAPADEEGLLVNRVVELVEESPEITDVASLCAATDLSERALQRLTRRRLGLTPRWLIQRRRLHEACERLRSGAVTIAEVAADLGYADQPHLTRDVRAVTGMTPGQLVAQGSTDA